MRVLLLHLLTSLVAHLLAAEPTDLTVSEAVGLLPSITRLAPELSVRLQRIPDEQVEAGRDLRMALLDEQGKAKFEVSVHTGTPFVVTDTECVFLDFHPQRLVHEAEGLTLVAISLQGEQRRREKRLAVPRALQQRRDASTLYRLGLKVQDDGWLITFQQEEASVDAAQMTADF